MAIDPDNPEHRAAVFTGRSRALGEVTVLVNRLGRAVDPAVGPETTLNTLASNWLELVSWLDQAALEAIDELELFHRET